MDWKNRDRARRSVGHSPIQLDVIESYAQSKISRRDFLRRGTIVGLSLPLMGTVIAACGDDDGGATETTAAPGTTAAGSTGGIVPGGTLVVGNQVGDAASGLDPVNMLDFGTYNMVAQSFEFLVGVGDDGNISADTGLATGWEPNDDGSVWTFNLRQGVMWQDGTEMTSADVAATMDRLAAAENAGLAGVIAEGAVDASDPAVAVFNLEGPNGNFPYLVSIFNAQSMITPEDYSNGTTLDERPEGTGPFILESYDAANSIARYVKNENWWRGEVFADGVELRGFADPATNITAMTSREIDVIQQFAVLGGEGLLEDPNFTTIRPPSSAHRKLWFNTQQGQFTDARVRQAVAYAIDREQIISTIYNGAAELGNDHPIVSTLPFFPEGAVEQRARDLDRARALMAEAGVTELTTTFATETQNEMPDLSNLIAAQLREIGITVNVDPQDGSTFFGDSWCPGPSDTDDTLPCDGSAEIGLVGWGHRPVPNVFLTSGFQTGAVWNAANYAASDYDEAVNAYAGAVDVDGQKSALAEAVQILHRDTPGIFHTFFNYLAGHDNSVQGVQATALGHTLLGKAGKTA